VNGAAQAQVRTTPFLNISQNTINSGERGLLGLAFDPNYSTNGYFFVNYIDKTTSNTKIARYQASPPSSNVTTAAGTVLKIITQPYANHNGGDIHFGPDGYLYIAMGDGGDANDPQGLSQSVNNCTGSKNCCECTLLSLLSTIKIILSFL
jgi:glucose/arabinose dehydrogenase